MDLFQNRYYRIPKLLMTMIGQWPYLSTRASRSFVAIVIGLSIGMIIPVGLAAIQYREDQDIVVDCLAGLGYAGGSGLRLFTFMWNWKKILKMLNRISSDWLVWADDREVNILHEYAEQGRKIIKVYTVVIYSVGFLYVAQPVVPKIIDVVLSNGSKLGNFPVPVYYYHLDTQKYYFFIIISMFVSTTMVLTVSVTYDVMLIVYVQHGCGLFAATGKKLERIGEPEESQVNEEPGYNSERREKALEQLVFSCISRHNDAIEYAKLIDTTYSWTFFITVVCRIGILSMTGLQIVSRMNEPQETARFVAFAAGLIVYVYMESYIAQILMDHSVSIRDHIQNGQWYCLSLKCQKLLQLMTMRCNVPCTLTAGKMMNISVESFAVFLRMSMSYLTVLRSI